jgi:signal transduction histidine kinase/DNA-binding NarL/FixJ family response regulator
MAAHRGPISPMNGVGEAPLSSHILIVDDRPANLTALEAILEPLGQEIVRANSGTEALRHVLQHDFAVILMDVQMPAPDGLETAALIKQRERSRHIPILFLSAFNTESTYIGQGFEIGAVDYLVKPLNPDILRSKVKVFVDLYLQGELLKKQAVLLREAEREALERKLEIRFRRLTDLMPQCVWAARSDGRIYYSNKAWAEYVGACSDRCAPPDSEPQSSKAEVPFLSVLHPDDCEQAAAAWTASLEHGQPFEVQARLRRHSDETYRWHLARGLPERDDRGQILGFIITATDIDDQKCAESLEHEARTEAERANRLKDEFLANVSHELRTPLNAIVGWTQILRSGKLDEDRIARALETIARNANLQLQLIQDILDVSRIIAGKLRIQIDSIDPIFVVQSAIDAVRPAAEAKGVMLEAILEPCEKILGDPDRLQQVIWNLLSNAVKFTPTGGRVAIRLRPLDTKLELIVTDDGAGIPPEFLPHVFERFSQADTSTTRKNGGLGLGLSIVHHLVELHRGAIRAESPGEGQGATFTVELPTGNTPVPSSHSVDRALSG